MAGGQIAGDKLRGTNCWGINVGEPFSKMVSLSSVGMLFDTLLFEQ